MKPYYESQGLGTRNYFSQHWERFKLSHQCPYKAWKRFFKQKKLCFFFCFLHTNLDLLTKKSPNLVTAKWLDKGNWLFCIEIHCKFHAIQSFHPLVTQTYRCWGCFVCFFNPILVTAVPTCLQCFRRWRRNVYIAPHLKDPQMCYPNKYSFWN